MHELPPPHPHSNPTDTCCEICLLCAESARRKKSVGGESTCMWCSSEQAGFKASDSITHTWSSLCGGLLPELMRWLGADSGDGCTEVPVLAPCQPQISPPPCSARRNMAILHPGLFLLSPVGWRVHKLDQNHQFRYYAGDIWTKEGLSVLHRNTHS